MGGEEGLGRSSQRSKILNFFLQQNKLKVVVVVYSFHMHKKRHTMTSVKAAQRETTLYAYCG